MRCHGVVWATTALMGQKQQVAKCEVVDSASMDIDRRCGRNVVALEESPTPHSSLLLLCGIDVIALKKSPNLNWSVLFDRLAMWSRQIFMNSFRFCR